MRKVSLFGAILLVGLIGCSRLGKPLEITETGWIVGCSDTSPQTSSSHGNPWILFSTNILGHMDSITLSAKNAPHCSEWKKTQSTEWDLDHKREPDYELIRQQHTDWLGQTDDTWDLVKVTLLTH